MLKEMHVMIRFVSFGTNVCLTVLFWIIPALFLAASDGGSGNSDPNNLPVVTLRFAPKADPVLESWSIGKTITLKFHYSIKVAQLVAANCRLNLCR